MSNTVTETVPKLDTHCVLNINSSKKIYLALNQSDLIFIIHQLF